MKSAPYGLLHKGPDGQDVEGPEALTFAQALKKFHNDPDVTGVYIRQTGQTKVVFHEAKKEGEKS